MSGHVPGMVDRGHDAKLVLQVKLLAGLVQDKFLKIQRQAAETAAYAVII